MTRYAIHEPLNILIVCYFFLRLELVNKLIPSIWFVFLISIILLAILIFGSMNISQRSFLIKKNIWILISLIILLVYKFYNYGNFRLDYMIQYLLFSLPFLIVGYSYSLKKKKLDKIVFSILILYFLAYFPSILTYLFSGDFTRDNIKLIIFKGQENSGLIHAWPFLASIILISWGSYKSIKTSLLVNIMLFVSWTTLVVFIFFSGYMSGIVFILLSITSIYFFNLKSFQIFTKPLIFILLAYFMFLILSTYSVGAIHDKVSALGLMFSSGFSLDDSILNGITSSRWFTAMHSINQFYEKPFFGNGIYLESVSGMLKDVESFDTASGGHNFFIDLTAFMGIFSIPLILVYINFIKLSRKVSKLTLGTSLYKVNVVIYSIFVSVFISNILNSWLLFSALDNLIFLLAGYVCGQLYLNEKNIGSRQL